MFNSEYGKENYNGFNFWLFIDDKKKSSFSFLSKPIFFHCSCAFRGLAELEVNNFLAALNILNVTSVTFKRQGSDVGSVFKTFANKTCNEALIEGEMFSRNAF